ncbi:hypothetical protein B0J13DRAFT_453363 [Dactylonectria estremocensis]|uniref:NAD-dependent epimerase/dehydratase domain-containing protein n=1 Tax=Dactylonectria estremocensis TaxID=1079267 RepID=A0A9P9ISH8_9HYPO|nr:hypothetical protein B0J13DRAFT_453363 [Dactylonectria estremocensis]
MSNNTTAIPKGSRVLVTAANGYTGSHIVMELLKQGFKVRGTVRDLASGQWLLDDDFVSPFAKRGDVELVVADTSVPNAFDDVVKGVSAVIHVAIISDMVADPNIAVPATVEAALTVCRSAAREPSIKRFVFTSTFWAAAMPTPGVTDTITNLDTWNQMALQAAWAPPPYEADRAIPVYCASKVEAEKAVWKFVQDEKPSWVVNSVSPCFILGDLRVEKHLRSVPPQLFEQLYLGNKAALQIPAMYYSHVTDVAVIHVAAALDADVSGKRIQVLANSFNWNDCLEILRRAYPERQFIDNFLPDNPTLTYDIENDIGPGLIQKWAGRDWISLETSVTETVDFIVKQKNLQGRGRQPRVGVTNVRPQQSEPSVVQFINTTHPDDTTSSKSLSLIRSHVAKHSWAFQRERKQNHHHRSGHSSSVAKTRLRLLAPKPTAPTQRRTPGSTDVYALSPIQLIGGARKDAYQGFARALSDDEQNLFDFYLTYVIQYGYKACYHKEKEAVFQAAMREIWVPFAMTHPGLMAAIFQIACRNYVANTNNENTEKYAVKKLQYRLTCLSAARDAIACQNVASDATIFLALLMASESHFEGEMDAFYAHGNGIIKMVTARGGLRTLGVSGFLEQSVAWSIYSPRHNLVMGPEEVELDHWL